MEIKNENEANDFFLLRYVMCDNKIINLTLMISVLLIDAIW